MFNTHPHYKNINAETRLLNIISGMAYPGVTCHTRSQAGLLTSSGQEVLCKRHQGSSTQASPLPKHLYQVTCQHTESKIFSSLLTLKRLHTHFSRTEGKDTSDKEVLVKPLRLQGRATQEIN